MAIGSKVVTFRLPVDLAAEMEEYCEEHGTTHGELLRSYVDGLLYPSSAELDSPEQLYGVKATEQIVELVNAQVKEQLKDQLGELVEEHLELVQVDRAPTEAEKQHISESLANLGRDLDDIKTGVNALGRIVNNNVAVSNESFERVSRLFQLLEAHSHNDHGAVRVSDVLAAELVQAEKRVGELPGDAIIEGKIDRPGYRYLEYLNLSVKG